MYLIVGLGNIGSEYFNTRHNVGFDYIDGLSGRYLIDLNEKKFDGMVGSGLINNNKVILAKPTTYMNLSGKCIRQIKDFYKIPNENIIVIYDDISLDVGKVRIRPKGSAGGHNGIKSIISEIGCDEFPRIRIGIGNKPQYMELSSYVLGRFSVEERKIIDKVIVETAEAITTIITEGVEKCMSIYNGVFFKVET